MCVLGLWNITKTVILKNDDVVKLDDVIEIRELLSQTSQRMAKFICMRNGMVVFSGKVKLSEPGDQISGAFVDGGVDYIVDAQSADGIKVSGVTWSKVPAAESGGEWDGNRRK